MQNYKPPKERVAVAEHGGSGLESHYLGAWDRSARNLRSALGKHQLPDQKGLHSKTLSQKKRN